MCKFLTNKAFNCMTKIRIQGSRQALRFLWYCVAVVLSICMTEDTVICGHDVLFILLYPYMFYYFFINETITSNAKYMYAQQSVNKFT